MPGPSLRDSFYSLLGLHLPTAPDISEEERLKADEAARQAQVAQPAWKRVLGDVMTAPAEALSGMFYDPAGAPPTADERNPAFAAGAMAAALPFGPKGIKGAYSRVEKIAETLPSAINPNKLASIFKNRTAAEELGWRKVPEFLEGFSAQKPVPKEALLNHLHENPLDVKVTEKVTDPQKFQHQDAFDSRGFTQYEKNYQMPGANNYRETLIQLDKPHAKGINASIESDELDAPEGTPEYGTNTNHDFLSQHWDEPNVLVHVRHNERRLPGPLPEGYHVQHGTDDRFNPAVWVEGNRYTGPSVRVPEDVDRYSLNAPEFEKQAADKAMLEALGPKGRMLENVQSDWHQRGAHAGYGEGSLGVEQLDAHMGTARDSLQTRLQEAAKAIDEWHQDYADMPEDILRPEDMSFIQNRLLAEADRADPIRQAALRGLHHSINEARVAYDNAADAAHRALSQKVPDAPFKDNWAELALKQQLLDIAHNRPDLQWLGIAPSSELRSRGEVISPEFQDKQLPRTLEKLLQPFGGKVETADIMEKGRPFFNPQGSYASDNSGPVTEVSRYLHGNDENPTSIASVYPKSLNSSNPDKAAASLLQQLTANRPDLLKPEMLKAPIARLTPELLQQLREKGFPLLAILAMMGPGALQSSHQPER